VEFNLKIHPEQRIGYFQREIVDQFGTNLKILADARAFVAYREGEDPNIIIRSLQVLIQDLKLRADLLEIARMTASDSDGQDDTLIQSQKTPRARRSLTMSGLPKFIEERINKLSDETKVNADTLRAEHVKIFSDPFIQNDPKFVTDLQRHSFTIMVLIARTRARTVSTKTVEIED
jgi:hypothetical protein